MTSCSMLINIAITKWMESWFASPQKHQKFIKTEFLTNPEGFYLLHLLLK